MTNNLNRNISLLFCYIHVCKGLFHQWIMYHIKTKHGCMGKWVFPKYYDVWQKGFKNGQIWLNIWIRYHGHRLDKVSKEQGPHTCNLFIYYSFYIVLIQPLLFEYNLWSSYSSLSNKSLKLIIGIHSFGSLGISWWRRTLQLGFYSASSNVTT